MNHDWEKKRLDNVCSIKSGYTPSFDDLSSKGEFPYFKVAEMNLPGNEKYLINTPSYLSGNIKTFPANSIVFPKNGAAVSTNKKRILQVDSVVDLNTAVMIANQSVSVNYLYYILISIDFVNLVKRGAVPTLNISELKNTVVSVPPMHVQEQIVSELDKINELIEIKRNQIKDLDALAQSLFYETFGEPFINSKGWPIMNFGNLASSINYGTSLPAVDGGYYPYIRMNNLTDNGYLDLSNLKYIDIPESKLDKCLVRKGDILFNRTNSREKVGKSALFDRADKMVIAGYIIRVRAKADMLNPVFAVRYLNLPELKEHLRKICRGAVNQANINSKEMASIPFIVPPINLQNQFASKIEAIEAQKKLVEASIADLEIILASRMDYWFND